MNTKDLTTRLQQRYKQNKKPNSHRNLCFMIVFHLNNKNHIRTFTAHETLQLITLLKKLKTP